MADPIRSLVVSTPGKVLICGGYVVIKNAHSLVLTTTARFYSRIETLSFEPRASGYEIDISVSSAQYGKTWNYHCSWDCTSDGEVTDFEFKDMLEEHEQGNIYVHCTLFYALASAACFPNKVKLSSGHYKLNVVLEADNDFYSHSKKLREEGKVPSQENLRKLPPFSPLGTKVAKTGLGSSAALVASLTAAMLVWACDWHSLEDSELNFVHNVAQVAHCQAQGKIGSGFDIAAAMFGSQQYVRFHTNALDAMMSSYQAHQRGEVPMLDILTHVKAGMDKTWFASLPSRVRLPPGLSMVLGECGKDMNTPTSVSLVLKWSETNPAEWNDVFQRLNTNTLKITQYMQELEMLYSLYPSEYKRTLAACAAKPASEWKTVNVASEDVQNLLILMSYAFKEQRSVMKKLGDDAGTPIEPDEITNALNETEAMKGVLATGAPGAGGYDAVFAIVLDESLIPEIEHFWIGRKEFPLVCLLARESPNGIILVRNSPPSQEGTNECFKRSMWPWYGAAVVALAGIVLGGLGLSRMGSKRR